MAIYLYDQYGRSKYGPRLQYEYGVYPFSATTLDYSTVLVEWNQPNGDWDGFRLLRSRVGYVTSPLDGQIVYSAGAGTLPGQVVDNDLVGGWYYYTILLHNPGSDSWEQAGVTSILVPFDYDSTERLWSYLPEYYRNVRDTTTAGYSDVLYNINPQIYLTDRNTVENDALFRYLTVLGWGLDILRTQIDTILDGYNVDLMHVSRLSILADQFGAVLESSVPTRNNRSLVKNLPLLYRKRGTIGGLRDVIALTTGWEVEITRGPNMMLNRDQAMYTEVNVPFWDPGTRYVEGDIVFYNGYPRSVVPGHTPFGPSQAPASGQVSNTYWDTPGPGGFFAYPHPGFSWKANLASGGVIQATSAGAVVSYGPTPVFTEATLGTLGWVNIAADMGTHDVVALSIDTPDPVIGYDRKNVTKWGIPIPKITNVWEQQTYYRGERVLYHGVVYEAQRETTLSPADASWSAVGYDERLRLGYSFYAHGADLGTAGSGGVTVTPFITLFDETGAVLFQGQCKPPASTTRYDSFNKPGAVGAGRNADFGPAWSGSTTAGWLQTSDSTGGYIYPSQNNAPIFKTVGGAANGYVGVTFRKIRSSRQSGIVFRLSSGSNYWMALNTGLYKVVNNITSTVVDWADAHDGDRLVVKMNGNSIIATINSVQVASVTDSFNSTAIGHGVVVL